MANISLATRCPHCKTAFLVSEEQLRLHSGTVRCGACSRIFNGTSGLIGRIVHSPSHNPLAEPETPTVLPENMPDSASDRHERQTGGTPVTENTAIHSDKALREAFDRQLKTISLDLDDFSTGIPSETDLPETDTPSASAAGSTETSETNDSSATIHTKQDSQGIENISDTPDTSSGNPSSIVPQQRRKSRISGVFWSIGIVLLFVILSGQLLYQYSERIVLWWPPARNMVNTTCKLLACPAGNSLKSSLLQVEYGELAAVENASDKFTQQIVIVNSDTSHQPWPSLVMEISDVQSNNVLSRRILEPGEYLPNESGIDKEWLPSGKTVFQLNIEYQHDSAINSRIILINR